MKTKIYFKSKENHVDQILESVTKDTKIVKVKASDYDLFTPIERDVDVEGKIVCGADYILSCPEKVTMIIDCELLFAKYQSVQIRDGEIVEFDGNKMIKTPYGYRAVEIETE